MPSRFSLSDGVMNLTLLHFPEGTKGGKGGIIWQLHEKFAAVLLNLLLGYGLVFDHESEVMQPRPVRALASTLKRNSKTLMALCSTCLSTAGASLIV
jgi:hypothetical protein